MRLQSISGKTLPFAASTVFLWAAPVDIPSDPPQTHGMSAAALEEWRSRLAQRGTTALLVVRDDKIVYEWYAQGHGPEHKEGTASLAKAIVGGSSLMVAMQDGRIKAGDLASTYIPLWKSDSQKSRITIRELATHTSGLEDAEQDLLEHMSMANYNNCLNTVVWTVL